MRFIYILCFALCTLAFGCEQYPDHPEQFYQALYPMVKILNTQMTIDHQYIEQAYQQWQHEHTPPKGLIPIMARYNITTLDDPKDWQILLNETTPIPIPIVLAQAALESGYGRAHLARKSCNLFGLRCYTPGCGVIPANRPRDATYAVRTFPTIKANLQDYYHIINTHTAYERFREKRSENSSIEALVATLTAYAGIGSAYPQRLEHLIYKDHLHHYDQA